MIKIVFFAALREQLGCSAISLPASNITTIDEVKKALVIQHPHWHEFLSSQTLLSAVNHTMVNAEHSVKSGDEVAFFPPVTGG